MKKLSSELSIKEKEKLLAKVRRTAKTKFHGIDKQIDMFIDAITGWYLYPELQTKPTVVNLWGLTGVGKTTLVRYVVGELGMGKSYSEVLMQNDTKDRMCNIKQSINISNLKVPYVLLLDEFQRYTTVDSMRKPKENISYIDLWSLLSDGNLYDPNFISISHRRAFCNLIELKATLVRGIMNVKNSDGEKDFTDRDEIKLAEGTGVGGKKVYSVVRDTIYIDPEVDRDLHQLEILAQNNYLGGSENLHLYKKPFVSILKEAERCGILSSADVEVYKYKLHNIAVDFKMVSTLNTKIQPAYVSWEDLYRYISDSYDIISSKEGIEATKATKLLIIISGNRDELYTQADGMYLTYKDVDSVYEDTKDFKWYQLRNLLLDSLSPEQINRLGMTHILFPSLNSKAYKQIINDRLNSAYKYCEKQFGVKVKFSSSVYEAVYKNSVFPVQGVRPVISFIDGLINSTLLQYLTVTDKKGKIIEVEVDEKTGKLYIKSDKKSTEYPIVLEVSDKEKDIPEECRISTAAHEAGHALTGMFLWDCVATIDMAPMMNGVLGLTTPTKNEKTENAIGSLHKYFKGYLCMLLAGKAAEELVFGQDNVSRGCSSDMRYATSLVFQMIRNWGLSSNIVSTSSSDYMSNWSKTSNLEQEDLQAEYILNGEYNRALDILNIVRPVFIEMVEYLREHSYMDKKKSQEFLKKVKKIRSSNSLSSYSEKKLWKKFKGEK